MATNAIHGRFGALLVDQSASANSVATPLGNLSDWTINESRDQIDTTVLLENNKSYTAGLKDFTSTYNGVVNSGSTALYTVGDGVARTFYHYIDYTDSSTRAPVSGGGKGYWYGQQLFNGVSTTGGVSDAVKWTMNGAASGSIYRV